MAKTLYICYFLAKCEKGLFYCAHGLSCLSLSTRCNNQDDCGDFSDEENCSKSHIIITEIYKFD